MMSIQDESTGAWLSYAQIESITSDSSVLIAIRA